MLCVVVCVYFTVHTNNNGGDRMSPDTSYCPKSDFILTVTIWPFSDNSWRLCLMVNVTFIQEVDSIFVVLSLITEHLTLVLLV